ncbi:MAG: hypothetical protein ACLQGU_03905 [bacterium]
MKKEILRKIHVAPLPAVEGFHFRQVIRGLVLNFLCVLILACDVSAQPQQKPWDEKTQDVAVDTLRRYLELRLNDADWKEYSKFITWPDEPAWDCKWVISKYDLKPAEEEKDKITVPVMYKRLGLFCYDFEFKPNPEIATINYELVKRPSGWKVNAPIPDYPEISADVLIRSLKALAEKANETPERRVKAKATVRKLGDALNHARSSR